MLTNFLRIMISRSLKPFVFENSNEDKLDLDVKNLGINVHTPFCETICPFCPYNKDKYNEKTAEDFGLALKKEIRQKINLFCNAYV